MTVIEKADRFTQAQPSTAWRRWAVVFGLAAAACAGIYIVYFSSLLTVHEERVLGAVDLSGTAATRISSGSIWYMAYFSIIFLLPQGAGAWIGRP